MARRRFCGTRIASKLDERPVSSRRRAVLRLWSVAVLVSSHDFESSTFWVLNDGDALIVTTPIGSGKVKRLRNNSAVTVAPTSRMGKTDETFAPIPASGEILDDPASVERYSRLFAAKYRFEYKLFMWIERRGKNGQAQRVMLRIT